ncbi:phospholipid/glycerol acyltransferase [Shewanella denitrificans OS217]|uniref:Phospholipid/glycerol acyltransferase n=1 Tax=Shewanella denitrificans (strain OS217 / ATCC BAA-1090 / DSM 15013) TaxID=318161 RepID=Q12IM8_SHEDO|nr:acyltransferase [Shewanella denitrificans]ABE56698.1 phospholipid/glycerol acyltransferase [Shewanella denitrificans OS217]
MLSFLPGPILFLLSGSLFVLSTFLWGGLISIGGIIKLFIPTVKGRIAITHVMNHFMWCWALFNGVIINLIAKIDWDVKGLEQLDNKNWYLLISNHISGLDIAAQSYLLRNNIPMLKFFLKKELLYVPILGLGCWALDMPFMDRTSPAKVKKNPKLKGKDLRTTRQSCEKFKHMPTSIINYVEGSRFTREKHQRQASPYRYLLKPKAGGIAFTLSAMGEQFTQVLNLTLVYPDAPEDTLKAMMLGKISKITMRVECLDVPQVDAELYFSNPEYRAQFQRWLNQVWQEKDQLIHELIQEDKNKISKLAQSSINRG